MPERSSDEIAAGIESATAAEPFLMSKAEFVAHLEAQGGTGCGGYSTVEYVDGKRVVAWDYACKD
jgi:hypothetical protein